MASKQTLAIYARRYQSSRHAPARPGRSHDSVQELIAYLYSEIRDDDAMVQAMDRALKEHFGDEP